MSKMNPEVFAGTSDAEKYIFEFFRDRGPNDWHVIYSFHLPNHPQVDEGEADFVVIVPQKGVFVLEIKGGQVEKLENGNYKYTRRDGRSNEKTRSPFQQAYEGMYSVAETLETKLGENYGRRRMQYSWGVIFTDEYRFDMKKVPEYDNWRLCKPLTAGAKIDPVDYIEKLHNKEIEKLNYRTDEERQDDYLDFLREYQINTEREPGRIINRIKNGPTDEESEKIYLSLRSPICYQSPLTYIRKAEEQIRLFTEDQYECLNDVYLNREMVVFGGAGTGKTYLAIEEAKYYSDNGKKVGLFCFNDKLSQFLKNELHAYQNVRVEKFHTYLWQRCRIERGDTKENEYYETILPERALEALQFNDPEFDVIIVDEFQDLCIDNYLKVFDKILKGGLFDGTYTFYGDFNNQLIYNNADLTYLENYSRFTRKQLTTNCRNTIEIGKEIKNITGYDGVKYLANGDQPVYCQWTSNDEQAQLLNKIIHDNKKTGYQIMVLSRLSWENSIVSKADKMQLFIKKNWSIAPDNRTVAMFSTIQSFKGLDAPIVVIADVDDYRYTELMYVGLSRAKSKLIVLESENARRQRQRNNHQ